MRSTPYRGDGHDTERIMKAKAKRDRKNAKRLRDAEATKK